MCQVYTASIFNFSTCFKSTLFFACHKLYKSCIASQLSSVRPSVFDKRNAISGEILLSLFTKRLNVEGDTFSFSATVRALILKGVK